MNNGIGQSTIMTEQWENEDGKKLIDAEEMSSMGADNEPQFCKDSYHELFKSEKQNNELTSMLIELDEAFFRYRLMKG